jgi:hypothetical protein
MILGRSPQRKYPNGSTSRTRFEQESVSAGQGGCQGRLHGEEEGGARSVEGGQDRGGAPQGRVAAPPSGPQGFFPPPSVLTLPPK